MTTAKYTLTLLHLGHTFLCCHICTYLISCWLFYPYCNPMYSNRATLPPSPFQHEYRGLMSFFVVVSNNSTKCRYKCILQVNWTKDILPRHELDLTTKIQTEYTRACSFMASDPKKEKYVIVIKSFLCKWCLYSNTFSKSHLRTDVLFELICLDWLIRV